MADAHFDVPRPAPVLRLERFRRLRDRPALGAVLALALSCAACGDKQEVPRAPPPAPVVLVLAVKAEAVPVVVELPGRIEALRTAEVRARVDGIVERMLYREGSDVAAGAPLFQIDPRDSRTLLQQAQAALQRAQAARANNAAVLTRFESLVSRKAVSAQEYDAAVAALAQADANVADARAAVDRAQLTLDRSTVRAPIAGRVGRAQVTEGALVSAGAATLMAEINQLSPIHAVFTQSNSDWLDFVQDVQSGALKVPDKAHIEVRLLLSNGQSFGPVGNLNFADLAVDPTTGSQTLRAQFPNPDRSLLPGQFVRGRVAVGISRPVVRVPERAVQLQGAAASVTVVAADGSTASRSVELGTQTGGDWIIRSGLKDGERVVVDGWHKIRPGQKVDAQAAASAAGR